MLSLLPVQVSPSTPVPRSWYHCRLLSLPYLPPLPVRPPTKSAAGLVSAPLAWMKCCMADRSLGRPLCCSAHPVVGKPCLAFTFWLPARVRESRDYTLASMSPLSGSSRKLIRLGSTSATTSRAG